MNRIGFFQSCCRRGQRDTTSGQGRTGSFLQQQEFRRTAAIPVSPRWDSEFIIDMTCIQISETAFLFEGPSGLTFIIFDPGTKLEQHKLKLQEMIALISVSCSFHQK